MADVMETTYEHTAGNGTFTVTAAERWSVNMIRRLADKHPEDVTIIAENEDGSIIAHLPASWMKIRPQRRRELTDEQRAEIGERLKASRGM